METIEKGELQEKLLASIDDLMSKLRVAIPESYTKPQIIAILQLFVELYA